MHAAVSTTLARPRLYNTCSMNLSSAPALTGTVIEVRPSTAALPEPGLQLKYRGRYALQLPKLRRQQQQQLQHWFCTIIMFSSITVRCRTVYRQQGEMPAVKRTALTATRASPPATASCRAARLRLISWASTEHSRAISSPGPVACCA